MNLLNSRQGGSESLGHLFLVGGGEDRRGDMRVLERYVDLCGGLDCSIAILTSASTIPEEMWRMYDAAFSDLGVRRRFSIIAENRIQADDRDSARKVIDADGIFMTGGDQKRLVDVLGGTRIHGAMARAFRQHAACIGGTSAGASAIARHMLAYGTKEKLPDKHTACLETGLGFLKHVVIDQHFSERQRLARLLLVIAKDPELIGVGVDEDTALIIGADSRVEVIGAGAVTLLDGRKMDSNADEIDSQERLELVNVILHLLPAGSRYDIEQMVSAGGGSPARDALLDALQLTTRTSHETT